MDWKKPKKIINNSLIALAILSVLGSILWLSIYYIWNNRIDLVNQYDNNMPNIYANKIDRLMTRTHKGKSTEDTFRRYKLLAAALKGTTALHKYYDIFTENQTKMIDYLLQVEKLEEARQLAKNWQKDYPYDFKAKFKYAEVLNKIDTNLVLDYYQEIYHKHKDIFELNQRYVALLLKQGLFNQALNIAEYSKTQNRKQTNVEFYFYYADEQHPKYSEKSKIFVPSISASEQNYQIKFTLKPQGLKKLRFDLDRLKVGSTITDLFFNIKTQTKEFTGLSYKPLRDLISSNETLTVVGKDPYVQILLPDELIGSSQELQLETNVSIVKNKPLVLDVITQHPDWNINCSDSLEFQQNQERTFSLMQQANKYRSKSIAYEGKCQYIKIQFPSQQNFTFAQLEIKLAEQELLSGNIVSLNGIKQNDSGFYVVSAQNPFVVLKLNQDTTLNEFNLQMKLGNKQRVQP